MIGADVARLRKRPAGPEHQNAADVYVSDGERRRLFPDDRQVDDAGRTGWDNRIRGNPKAFPRGEVIDVAVVGERHYSVKVVGHCRQINVGRCCREGEVRGAVDCKCSRMGDRAGRCQVEIVRGCEADRVHRADGDPVCLDKGNVIRGVGGKRHHVEGTYAAEIHTACAEELQPRGRNDSGRRALGHCAVTVKGEVARTNVDRLVDGQSCASLKTGRCAAGCQTGCAPHRTYDQRICVLERHGVGARCDGRHVVRDRGKRIAPATE